MFIVKQLAALEPARLAGAVSALLVLLAAFGLHLTGDQQGAIVGLVSAVVPIIAAEVTRSQVTPVARPEDVAVHAAATVPQNGASVATPTPNPFLAAVVSAIESPAAQTAVLAAVTSGEVPRARSKPRSTPSSQSTPQRPPPRTSPSSPWTS